jgi:hypothetical protein
MFCKGSVGPNKKTKDFRHKPPFGLFIPFPFAFSLGPRSEKAKIPMQNHPKITSATIPGSCPFKSKRFIQPLLLSRYAFKRYLKPNNLHFQAGNGVNVYELPCGCSVWQFPGGGGRYLTALPFWQSSQ